MNERACRRESRSEDPKRIPEYQGNIVTWRPRKVKGWEGDIHTLRVDFFDQSEVGDTMYIKSIKLIEK